MWILCIKLKFLCFYRRGFTDWAISLCLYSMFLCSCLWRLWSLSFTFDHNWGKVSWRKSCLWNYGPIEVRVVSYPIRKNCVCHIHWQMTLLRVCLVQELGDIQDSHTLQCPQGNELFPECSRVFHMGGVFQCTWLEVTPSVRVCLTS